MFEQELANWLKKKQSPLIKKIILKLRNKIAAQKNRQKVSQAKWKAKNTEQRLRDLLRDEGDSPQKIERICKLMGFK